MVSDLFNEIFAISSYVYLVGIKIQSFETNVAPVLKNFLTTVKHKLLPRPPPCIYPQDFIFVMYCMWFYNPNFRNFIILCVDFIFVTLFSHEFTQK